MISFEDVKQELANRENKSSTKEGIVILFFTLVLFFSSGLVENSLKRIAMIIFVLLIHEAGHYFGMVHFKYKDVKMFFIPFFGAAVSGIETNSSSTKKAIVSLLGPLPGILIGLVLFFIHTLTKESALLELGGLFLFINCFNLLPIHALDGGRFFEHIIFSRSRFFEIIFKVVTIIILLIISIKFKMYLLSFFGFIMLMAIKNDYIASKVAIKIKRDLPDSLEYSVSKIPDEHLKTIIDHLNKENLSSEYTKSKISSNLAENIWGRVCTRPASGKSTAILLIGFIFSWSIALYSFNLYRSETNKISSQEQVAESFKKGFMNSCVNKNEKYKDFCTCVHDSIVSLGILKSKNENEQMSFIKSAPAEKAIADCRKSHNTTVTRAN